MFQHTLDHPLRMLIKVTGGQNLVPKEALDMSEHVFDCRLFDPTWSRLELDHEIAVECGGQLAEGGKLEP